MTEAKKRKLEELIENRNVFHYDNNEICELLADHGISPGTCADFSSLSIVII